MKENTSTIFYVMQKNNATEKKVCQMVKDKTFHFSSLSNKLGCS